MCVCFLVCVCDMCVSVWTRVQQICVCEGISWMIPCCYAKGQEHVCGCLCVCVCVCACVRVCVFVWVRECVCVHYMHIHKHLKLKWHEWRTFQGEEKFWTVAGDNVGAMLLCDINEDGKNELIAGLSLMWMLFCVSICVLRVWMCVCLSHSCVFCYMQAYVHTYIHTCIHSCVNRYIHTCMHMEKIYVHANGQRYYHTHIYTHIHKHILDCRLRRLRDPHIHIHTYMHTCIRSRLKAPTIMRFAWSHTYKHTRTHTYIHTFSIAGSDDYEICMVTHVHTYTHTHTHILDFRLRRLWNPHSKWQRWSGRRIDSNRQDLCIFTYKRQKIRVCVGEWDCWCIWV